MSDSNGDTSKPATLLDVRQELLNAARELAKRAQDPFLQNGPELLDVAVRAFKVASEVTIV